MMVAIVVLVCHAYVVGSWCPPKLASDEKSLEVKCEMTQR